MSKRFPRIGEHGKLPAAPKCACGAIATHWIEIRWTYMRGDDERVNVCDDHFVNRDSILKFAEPPLTASESDEELSTESTRTPRAAPQGGDTGAPS